MMKDEPRARCYLEVDTGALVNNLHAVEERVSANTRLIAVLKADAYGLGIVPVGKVLWHNGVRHFAVACLDEAFALREALPDAWILCMGESIGGALEKAVSAGIRLTVGSIASGIRVSEAAQNSNTTAYVHFKVDTGLHRIGFAPQEAVDGIEQCAYMANIHAEGLYTHLALHNRASDERQHEAFICAKKGLEARNVRVDMVHMCDSIGLIRYPQWQYDAVRVGAMLYGNYPNGYDTPEKIKATVRFAAKITRVFDVKAGEYCGYDDEQPLARDSHIAVIAAGYADGYPRVFSGKGLVQIRGKKARIVGLICMDQMMADVTDIEGVRAGDEAALLGDGISLREYAQNGHLNRNECTSIIGKRVPRIYV